MPSEEFRKELLRAFVQRVYYVFPILNIFDFLSAILLDESLQTISLLVFQAVMLSAIPYVSMDRLLAEGFHSRKQAQEIFFQRVLALYKVGYETEQLPMIQATFLLSLTDDPLASKDSWHWLGTSLSFAQAVNFHLDTPGYCERDKGLRRRVWWSIFAQDRKLALGMRHPCRISSDSYKVPMLSIDDFELDCWNPIIPHLLGEDMRLQDPDYQRRLAVVSIRTVAMSVVIGEILMQQYKTSLRTFLNRTLPSVALIPRRTATRQDIQLFEEKLTLCTNSGDKEFRWTEVTGNCQADDFEDETFLLRQAEMGLIYLTSLMALHRPQMGPVQMATSTGFDLQAYSKHQVRLIASRVLEICNIVREKGLLDQLPHITATSVHQAALIHLSFLNYTDGVEQMLTLSKFHQLFRCLKDMDDVHMTAKLGVSLLTSMIQKAVSVPESSLPVLLS